jgi:hypothetical protein
MFSEEEKRRMAVNRLLRNRLRQLHWHDTIILRERAFVGGRVYVPGDRLRIDGGLTVDARMRLIDELGRSVEVDGYDIAALRYDVIPAPDDEPF